MKKLSFLLLLGVLVGTLFAGVALAEEKVVTGSAEGMVLNPFKVTDLDGKEVASSTLVGQKPVAFVMVAVNCAMCRGEVDELIEKAKEKAESIYIVVAAPLKLAPRFTKSYTGPFKVLVDESYSAMSAMDFRVTPSTIVLDAKGKIVKKFSQYSEGQAEELVKLL